MIVDFHCHFLARFFRFREYRMNRKDILREMIFTASRCAVVSAAGEFAAIEHARQRRHSPCWPAFSGACHGFATINPWMRAIGHREAARSRELLGPAGLVLHPDGAGLRSQ